MTSRRTALKNAAKDVAAANAKRQQRAAKAADKKEKVKTERAVKDLGLKSKGMDCLRDMGLI